MHELFSLEDLFNVLIELETSGSKHYLEMVSLTNDLAMKEFFKSLSIQEESHKALYLSYKKRNIMFDQSLVTDEYSDYIRSMLNQTIHFLTNNDKIMDFSQGYELAVSLEKETIQFLLEVKKFLELPDIDSIDAVIEQEKQHLISLKKIKSSF